MVAQTRDNSRTLIVWEIPAVASPGFIEMYINPNNLQTQDRKLQNTTRTKGGYVLQYWGEELTTVSIAGNTGDGGIEALNVLRDIYRSEQIALAKFLNSSGIDIKKRQSLAQMAASVVMWYQGQGQRGFFTDFQFTESADTIGLFAYNINFTVVETIGRRSNFLPWQRKPWSTLDTPSQPDGTGSTTGGGYQTRFKMGELNSPEVSSQGILSDSKFTRMTGVAPPQNILLDNFEENSEPITPFSLFANT